jgi:hypothetical protein
MLIATFGPTTAWVGKSITYQDGRFILEGHGPVSPESVLEYDRQGHLIWAEPGLRAWIQGTAQQTQTVARSRVFPSLRLVIFACVGAVLLAAVVAVVAVAIPAYEQRREEARIEAVSDGIRIIRTGLDAYYANRLHAYPTASVVTQSGLKSYVHDWPTNPYTGWPMVQGQGPGDFEYWVDESHLSYGLTGYIEKGAPIKFVHRVPEDQATEEVIAEGLHSIEVGIESYRIDHGGSLPTAAEVSQAGLDAYVDDWPLNPYTNMPMTQSATLGNFAYSVSPDGTSFYVTAFGPNGATLTLPLQ